MGFLFLPPMAVALIAILLVEVQIFSSIVSPSPKQTDPQTKSDASVFNGIAWVVGALFFPITILVVIVAWIVKSQRDRQ